MFRINEEISLEIDNIIGGKDSYNNENGNRKSQTSIEDICSILLQSKKP